VRTRIALVLSALVVALVGAPSAQAATIPAQPAACHPTPPTPGTPMMTSFVITPTVDVTVHDKKIRVTATATDPTRDIEAFSVQLDSDELGTVKASAQINLDFVKGSGTRRNGTWTGTTVIPRWTVNGTWHVTQVGLSDKGGGFAFYFPDGGGSTYPWDVSWPKTFQVTSVPDVKSPALTSLKLSRSKVDTSKSTQRIFVKATAKDSLSGVGSVYVSAAVTIGTKYFSVSGANLKLTTKNPRNGTWKGSFVVPMWVDKGTHIWSLGGSVQDVAGNYVNFDATTLKALHRTSSFKVVSRTDSGKPVVSKLSIKPRTVDARAHDSKVLLRVTASDSLSGVSAVSATLSGPSGDTSTSYSSIATSGRGSHTLTLSVGIPRCGEPGKWVLSLDVYDNSGNVKHYSSGQLKAKGLPTTINVKSLDTYGPQASVPAIIAPTDPITVTFTEPTLWKDGTTDTALTVFPNGGSVAVAGAWTCKNRAGTTVTCDANGANVLTASFTPASPFTPEQSYVVKLTPDTVYDLSGNPDEAFAGLFTTM
jgi:hypothetical protein